MAVDNVRGLNLTGLNGSVVLSTVDDFEDQGLSEYTETAGTWNIDAASAEGSYALSSDETTNNNNGLHSMPGDGLPYYPTPGTAVEFLTYSDGQAGAMVNCGSNGEGYGCYIRDTSDIKIRDYDGAGSSGGILASQSVNISADTWYWGTAESLAASDSTIKWTLYEADMNSSPPTKGAKIASVSAADSQFAGQEGIGAYQVIGTSIICVDYLHVG